MESKKLLTEGVSQRVFHFTTLSSLYSMSEGDPPTIQLSDSTRPSDKKLCSFKVRDKNGEEKVITYPYYLSLSRTPFSFVGYVFMRFIKTGGEWSGALVRLELNSRLLNSDFIGRPVNFFNDGEDEIRQGMEKDKYKLIKNIKINGLKLTKEDSIFVGKSGQVYVNGKPLSQKYNDSVLYALRNPNVAQRDLSGKMGIAKDWNNFRAIPGSKSKGDRILRGKGMVKKSSMDLPVDFDQEIRAESERNLMSEYEDRIFSFKSEIDFNRYVERVDIYLPRNIIDAEGSGRKTNYRLYAMFGQIYRAFGDKVFLYDSLVAFNSVNIRNSSSIEDTFNQRNFKNVDIESKILGNEEDFSREVKTDFNNDNLNTLGIYLSFIAYHPEDTLQDFKNNVKSICRQCGLNKWDSYDGIKDYTPELLERSIISLSNFDEDSLFNAFSYSIRNYRYGTDILRVRLLNSLDKIANVEIKYSADRYFGGKENSISTIAKNKWEIGYNSKFARPDNINNTKKLLGKETKIAERMLSDRLSTRDSEKEALAQQIAMEKKASKTKKVNKPSDSIPFKAAADKVSVDSPKTVKAINSPIKFKILNISPNSRTVTYSSPSFLKTQEMLPLFREVAKILNDNMTFNRHVTVGDVASNFRFVNEKFK